MSEKSITANGSTVENLVIKPNIVTSVHDFMKANKEKILLTLVGALTAVTVFDKIQIRNYENTLRENGLLDVEEPSFDTEG